MSLSLDRAEESSMTSTRALFGKQLTAHYQLLGAMNLAASHLDSERYKASHADRVQDALMASFTIGYPVCLRTIEGGQYLQAESLLRQQLEIVTQTLATRCSDWKTMTEAQRRNIRHVKAVYGEAAGSLYGRLSGLAHVTNHAWLRSATSAGTEPYMGGFAYMTRFYPVFDQGRATVALAAHLYISLLMLKEMMTRAEKKKPSGCSHVLAACNAARRSAISAMDALNLTPS